MQTRGSNRREGLAERDCGLREVGQAETERDVAAAYERGKRWSRRRMERNWREAGRREWWLACK